MFPISIVIICISPIISLQIEYTRVVCWLCPNEFCSLYISSGASSRYRFVVPSLVFPDGLPHRQFAATQWVLFHVAVVTPVKERRLLS